MNELVVADRASEWRRLKALVLDSVSSPITRRVYNLGLDEFIAWFTAGAAARRIHEGDRHRLAGGARGPQARPDLDQRPDHGGPEAGGRGGRQRAAGAGTGGGDRADKGRPVARRPRRELAVAPPGAGAPERAGRAHEEGTARPGHVRHAARLRIAPVRTGEPDDETRPAAGQPLVHRGSGRQARARADDPDADVDEERDRCVDRRRRA